MNTTFRMTVTQISQINHMLLKNFLQNSFKNSNDRFESKALLNSNNFRIASGRF